MGTFVEDTVTIEALLVRLQDGTARLYVKSAQSYAGAIPVRTLSNLDVTAQAPAGVKQAGLTVLDWLATQAKAQFEIP